MFAVDKRVTTDESMNVRVSADQTERFDLIVFRDDVRGKLEDCVRDEFQNKKAILVESQQK